MSVHLLKMCVGVTAVEELARFQAMRRDQRRRAGQEVVNIHYTRNRPRRAAELLDGGSLYWIIKGRIRVRQRLIRLDEAVDDEGRRRCGLVLDARLVETIAHPARPMQGWRYLEADAAPADLDAALPAGDDELPPVLQEELRALGLL